MTGVFLSIPRYDWCVPMSQTHINISSCMLMNHGPSQQSSKEEYEPWKWGATVNYYTSNAKTMLPTNEEVCAMIQQAFRPHKDLLSIVKKNTNCSGMVMSPVHQIWLKPSFNARWKGEENKADRGRGGTTTSGNGETGVPKDPQGSGEQGKMKKTGCKIICGAPTTLVVTG